MNKKFKCNELNVYKVYVCKSKTTKKEYYGITKTDDYTECIYKEIYNEYLHSDITNDIKKYSLNDFEFVILHENLNFYSAIIKKRELIIDKKSIESGYNTEDDLCKSSYFDYCDFKVFNNYENQSNKPYKHFTKIPNILISKSSRQMYNIHPVLSIVYVTIDNNRNYKKISRFSIEEILQHLNLSTKNSKRNDVFHEIIKCIIFLKENNYIELVNFNITNIRVDSIITVKTLKKFDPSSDFTILDATEFEKITNMNSNCKKENLFSVFLYVKSCIWTSSGKNQFNYPKAFFRSIDKMSKDLDLSKQTVVNVLNELINGSDSLLVKYELNKDNKAYPNIYVLREFGFEKEIDKAKEYLLEVCIDD